MKDFDDVYSLLFTGVIILFFFLTVYNIIENLEESIKLVLEGQLLSSKALHYSKVLDASDNVLFINLKENQSLNAAFNNSRALPAILFNDSMSFGEVIVGE
ncbi:MAG: hypothetical protein JW791_03625 [Nanoarchaeota archaeon]|nr:hypothetical protein [Nanoarchaeota archaeon]